MAERITTLTTMKTNTGVELRETFTVNTAVNGVSLNAPGMLTGVLSDANGFSWLHAQDNFTLLSLGMSLPYGFDLGDSISALQLTWLDSLGNIGFFPNIGGSGTGNMVLPFANYEFVQSVYIPWPVAAIGSIRLVLLTIGASSLQNLNTQISMLNVPPALNGLTLGISSWVKISQNGYMYAAA